MKVYPSNVKLSILGDDGTWHEVKGFTNCKVTKRPRAVVDGETRKRISNQGEPDPHLELLKQIVDVSKEYDRLTKEKAEKGGDRS